MSNIRRTTNLLKAKTAAWSLTGITAGALLFSFLWHPAPPPQYQGLTSIRERIPKSLAGFAHVGENEMSADVKQQLASADIMSHTYRSEATGQTVDFTLIGGTDRSALHDPRSCLVGAGWRIENDHVETIPGTSTPIRVCRILNDADRAGNGQAPVWGLGYEGMYLYVVDGKSIDKVTQIRSQMLVSALIGRKNKPVCFVRFMRPLLADPQADAESHKRFVKFVSEMWQTARVPESQTQQQIAAATK